MKCIFDRLHWIWLFPLSLIQGCASFYEEPLEWRVRVVVPQHYDAWVQFFDMETSGVRHWRVPIGSLSCCWKSPSGKGGGGYQIPPPNFFQVRWFSYAERKFYGRLVELPTNLPEMMSRQTPAPPIEGQPLYEPQDTLVIGLAPGGQIVVWLMNYAKNAEEVLRVQANELDVNVAEYEVWIRDYETEHGKYLKQHGLQLDRW